jgi:hypothetical protein
MLEPTIDCVETGLPKTMTVVAMIATRLIVLPAVGRRRARRTASAYSREEENSRGGYERGKEEQRAGGGRGRQRGARGAHARARLVVRTDGVGDRVDLREREEGDLVVRVVVEAVEEELAPHPRGALDGDGGVPRRHEARQLVVGEEGKGEEEGKDGEDAVEVGGAEVLADGLVHLRLRVDGARREGEVGDHRAAESL